MFLEPDVESADTVLPTPLAWNGTNGPNERPRGYPANSRDGQSYPTLSGSNSTHSGLNEAPLNASNNSLNGALRNGSGNGLEGVTLNTTNGSPARFTSKFQNAYGACNFIVTWNGEDVRELQLAINYARQSGDRFIQDKLIEYILNIPFRNPRPADVPAFVGKPVWAVDKQGRALVGMPGSEAVITVAELREQAGKRGALPGKDESLPKVLGN